MCLISNLVHFYHFLLDISWVCITKSLTIFFANQIFWLFVSDDIGGKIDWTPDKSSRFWRSFANQFSKFGNNSINNTTFMNFKQFYFCSRSFWWCLPILFKFDHIKIVSYRKFGILKISWQSTIFKRCRAMSIVLVNWVRSQNMLGKS